MIFGSGKAPGGRAWTLLRLGSLIAAMATAGPASPVWAQQAGSAVAMASAMTAELPDAPDGAMLANGQAEASASVTGAVLDPNGAALPGARVTLTGPNGTGKRVMQADAEGHFSFTGLQAGTYTVMVTAPGLKTFVSEGVALEEGEEHKLPDVSMRIAGASTDVEVVATQAEVAQAQVKAQEKQRVLGIVPNFYSSYIWNAAPMTPKQKFGLALRSTADPVEFMIAGGVAGVEQWHNTFPGYGRGADGYLKRYGAAYTDNFVGRMLGSALLPTVFHQDPRYFYKGTGSVTSRTLYAVEQTVVCRGDNGHTQPNYSHVLGNFAAAGISNLYRAEQDRDAGLTVRNGFIILGSNAISNIVREFLLKGITSHVPNYGKTTNTP